MNLAPTLTETQRAALKETAAWITKLLSRNAAVGKKLASLNVIHAKLVKEIAELNVRADAGERDASRELLAAKDQKQRLETTIRLAEREMQELLEPATRAANVARNEIRTVHLAVANGLMHHIGNFLAPFMLQRFNGFRIAGGVDSVQQLGIFSSKAPRPFVFESIAQSASALESQLATLTTLIEGGAIVRLNARGDEGGLIFPACCE